jgi:hypothetical protein
MRVAVSITLSDEERATLERWARGRSVEARLVLRAKIVLAAAEGRQSKEIAVQLATLAKTVALWRERFNAQRLTGIQKDAPRGGRPATAKQEMAARIVKATTTETRREQRTGARARWRSTWPRRPPLSNASGRRRTFNRTA